MEKPQECYLTAVKRVLRYIKVTINHGVMMPKQNKTNTYAKVYGYTNSNFSEDHDEKKSIAGYIFMIEGAPRSWSSRKQIVVDFSSCKSKYMATSYVACQASWIEMLLEELKIMKPKKMKLFVDNKSVVKL
ncbi:secreted RxLR effector protein 161-like [Lathyrus oleraceus]|uniref:secreted RxLR effector protein 161-like n=1 Tax=Pisum sativum TaxID=3888 RepID=UPI0021D0C98E|nr:secreted RxLR effector protein 161-like [Pisum sativum]